MTFVTDPPPVIIDASVAIGLVAEDHEGLEARWSDWLTRPRMRLAPPTIWAEIANGLLRGRRMSAGEVGARLARLREIGIEVADRGHRGTIEAVGLAQVHRLTVYDAMYLQLAIDVDGTLATYDRALAAAAADEGVELEWALAGPRDRPASGR